MVYNLDCYYIQLNAKNQVIHKPLQNCSPFRKLQTGHSLYPLIEMICRVKLFKILPDGVQLRLLLCTIKHKEQRNPPTISKLFTLLKASDWSFNVCSNRDMYG